MFRRFFTFSNRAVPVFLLLIAGLTFGLLLPWLGFYWDDWAKILVSRLFGLRAYFAYYASDRPLSAWTHIAFTPLLGEGPLAWQVFALLLRWLSAWGMWWTLNTLWPNARRQNLVAALIFLVYPVFLQQPAAVTFHQQLLQYALFFLSLGAMLSAYRKPARFWLLTILALAAQVLQLSVTEYFTAVELVRPLLLVMLFAGLSGDSAGAADRKERRARWLRLAWQTLRAWAPYLAVLGVYAVWRLFFYPVSGRDPNRAVTLFDFFAHPLATLRGTLLAALVDELHILVDAWAGLLHFSIADAAPFTLLSYAVGLAAGGLVIFFLLRYRAGLESPEEGLDSSARWACPAFLLGLVAVLLGPVPAWLIGKQVVLDAHSDRYALPAMFGAALLFAAAIEWLAQRRVQRAVLAGVLVALAVGVHLRTANDYRWIWTSEQRFFWQLAWRAPGLQAPTALFLENEPFPNQGLFSTSAALNLMYPQPPGSDQLAYWVYTLRPRYQEAPDSLTIGLRTTFRTLRFTGQTPNSLLLYNDPARANCLWVLSPRDRDHPYLPQLVRDFLPISDPARILPAATPGYPPADLIGPEPPHTWCYYFEKADLARQQQDWTSVARLADEAKAQGYRPGSSGSNSPYEWLPFIEGLARAGQWQEAARLTRRASEQDAHYNGMLCALWSKTLPTHPPLTAETQQFLGCSAR